MLWTSKFGRKRAKFSATGLLAKPVLRKLRGEVRDLVESGDLDVTTDRRYRFDQIVQAHTYVELGHKKGNVVLEGPDDGGLYSS